MGCDMTIRRARARPYCVVFPEPVSPTMMMIWLFVNFGRRRQQRPDGLGAEVYA